MNWIVYPDNKPDITGTYLVSIERAFFDNTLTFNYVAYYNVENNNWYKYDSFLDYDSVGEKIEDKIKAYQVVSSFI